MDANTLVGFSGELIDGLVAWGLCGAWLGLWLNRPSNTPRKTYG